MDKSCANHPEAMALARCKACEKSICLMCVVDEKEGTFCSSECHAAFVEGRAVPRYEESAQPASVATAGAQKIESIFDEGSSAPSASEGINLPPSSDDPMPIVAEGTKWRSIGTQCDNHSDTPAVANCDRCAKPVCALCLLEASQGTFCSSDCMNSVAKDAPPPPPSGSRSSKAPQQPVLAAAERAALQGKPVFKFKEPPRSKKGPIIVVVVAILGVGGYYGWKAFGPEHFTFDAPPVVENPVTPDPRPVDPRPVDPRPVDPRPVDPTPVVTPDPTPVVKATDPEATSTGVYLRPRPVPKAVPTRTINPWTEEQPGCWFRLRTTSGGKTSYTDVGLKEKSERSYTLNVQTSTDGKPSEQKTEAPAVYLHGEKTLVFDGQSYLCEIQSPGMDPAKSPTTLVLLSSKYPGAVFKSDAPDAVFTPAKVWEYTMRVKGRSFDCLVVEGMLNNKPVKTYYTALPIQSIRQEKAGDSTVLVDFGDDWSKRPAFPN
jgi:hypothetical protein